MSGTSIGRIKAKLGLRGKTKTGEMIGRMNALKKTGTFKGKSNKIGGGGRFAQLVARGKSPALAAFIGRKSLGKNKFQKLASKGKKRAMMRSTA